MKDIYAPSLSDPFYQGAQGNESVAESQVVMKNLVTGDQIHLFDLPLGIRINSLQVCGSQLSADKTVKFVLLRPAADIELASLTLKQTLSVLLPIPPITTAEQGDTLALKVSAGPVNGRLNVLLRYTVIGY
ncbi:hypothetical protein ACVQ8M_08225 [Edwardsiella tarda]